MNIEILDVIDCRVSVALANIIKDELSYPAVFYRQGPHRKFRQEYMKTVMVKGEGRFYFPTGLLQRVLDFCEKNNIDVTTSGTVEKLKATKKPSLKGITLREEQLRLVTKAIKEQRGVLVAPTGIGKSLLGLSIVSAFPKASVLWLCHTKDLMYQAAEFAKKHLENPEIGFIGDGITDPKNLTFATRQSFIKHVGPLGCNYDIAIVDECFSSNTNIRTLNGQVPICKLTVGTKVFTEYGIEKIKHIFTPRVPLSHVVKLTLSNGNSIFCSKNHKFKVKEKWISACELGHEKLVDFQNVSNYMMNNITSDMKRRTYESKIMCSVRKRNNLHSKSKILFTKMLFQKQARGSISISPQRNSSMSFMSQRVFNSTILRSNILFRRMSRICKSSLWTPPTKRNRNKNLRDLQNGISVKQKNILFKYLPNNQSRTKKNKFRNNVPNKQSSKRYNFRANETKQSFKNAWRFDKTSCDSKNQRNFRFQKERRKRYGTDSSRTFIADFFRKHMDTQSGCDNLSRSTKRSTPRTWLPNKFKNRYWKSRTKNSYRSGRRKSLSNRTKETGSQKRNSINRIRVESIEIYQRGSNDESFNCIIGNKERHQGYVEFYDLEVENNHTYFAEDVLVHNCHHAGKEGQYLFLMRHVLAPVRIGLTATMPKDKEAILSIESALGPIIDEVTITEGQELGTMADIKVRFLKVPVDHKLRDLRKYSDVYEAGVVNNRAQHQIIVETAKKHVALGDSVLILVTQIAHGDNILDECERQKVHALYAQGSTESAVRKEIKDALNNKNIHVVIATTIFQEGINLPELNVIINAAGGKSEIRTMQAIGRGLRLTETKKELIFYDLVNTSHNFLTAHLGERLCIYTEANWI